MSLPDSKTVGPYAIAAPLYWAAGWKGVLPLAPRSKKGLPKGWTGNDGAGGGPVLANDELGYDWSTYPERLERASISWKVYQDSGTLSGGEKTKLALAMLMIGRNNLLLLDEPTNNLDPPSRQSVADALSDWKGSIVFVSHDTEFVEQLAPTKVLLMPDGEVDYFSADWLELVSLA